MNPARVKLFSKRATWATWAEDAVWRLRHRPLPPPPPSWPIGAEEARRLTVRWPTRYPWPPAGIWLDPIAAGLRGLVGAERAEMLPQGYPGILVLEVLLDGRLHEVALDYGDYAEVDEECARRCALYFKMQFRRDGYGHAHVVPGGYVPARPSVYRYLGGLRRLRDTGAFRADVYGRFSLTHAEHIRRQAVTRLTSQSRFRYQGDDGMVLFTRHLRDIAQSRVCVDLPGRGDLCHRLIDYLAVGAGIVGPRPSTVLHVPLVEGRHVVYARDDLEDLVDVCAALVEDPRRVEELTSETRAFFDRYLHFTQLAGYYVRTCLDRLASV